MGLPPRYLSEIISVMDDSFESDCNISTESPGKDLKGDSDITAKKRAEHMNTKARKAMKVHDNEMIADIMNMHLSNNDHRQHESRLWNWYRGVDIPDLV
jgi:hypothetical protein